MAEEQNKKKILFVDDDQFLLDMYSVKFGNAGYEVKVADSTENALKILREGYMPDVVLADIIMPVMDGIEMVGRIRAEKLASGAKIIMLTNQSASEDIARAKTLNVDSYIVKATTIPSEVLEQVNKILNTK